MGGGSIDPPAVGVCRAYPVPACGGLGGCVCGFGSQRIGLSNQPGAVGVLGLVMGRVQIDRVRFRRGQAARLIDNRSVSIDPWCPGLNQPTGGTAVGFMFLGSIDPDMMMIRSSGRLLSSWIALGWGVGCCSSFYRCGHTAPKSQARPHRPPIPAPNGRGGLESIDPCPHRANHGCGRCPLMSVGRSGQLLLLGACNGRPFSHTPPSSSLSRHRCSRFQESSCLAYVL